MYEIVIGKAERDRFDRPGPGHRTYRASDGHTYTGTWDVLHACVYHLDPGSIEDRHLPLVCAHCDTVLLGPATPTSDHPDPHNFTLTVRYDNGRTTDLAFAAIDAAVAHAMTVAHADAPRHPTITLTTGPDHLGPARHRRLTPPPT
jgi:hypothetical protein